jgi:hypothetical protein
MYLIHVRQCYNIISTVRQKLKNLKREGKYVVFSYAFLLTIFLLSHIPRLFCLEKPHYYCKTEERGRHIRITECGFLGEFAQNCVQGQQQD